MPYKLKHSVRRESKEIVELLLNVKKPKINDSSEVPASSSQIIFNFSDENLDASENEVSSSEEDAKSDVIDNMDIKREIAVWAVKHTITNRAINDLLSILIKHFPFLPKDARTLKQTPRDAPIVPIEGGNYVHYGLKDCLTDFLSCTTFLNNSIDLNINIDGFPVSKSSLSQTWPILINVNGTGSVLTAGISSGHCKPKDVNEFLHPFVNELTEVMKEHFTFDNKTYKLSITAEDNNVNFNNMFQNASNLTTLQTVLNSSLHEDANVIHVPPVAVEEMAAKISKTIEPILVRLTNEVSSLRQEINYLRNEIKQLKEEKSSVKVVIPETPYKVKELQTVAKTPNFIKNCWRKLLVDELAEKLCWKGTEEKKSVRSLSTSKAIR
ncbi:hypothetical protein CVS40_11806, partial [Lucilia cuprina]